MSFKSFALDRSFWKPTLRLAIPVALQNLLMSSAQMVDTVMVGQLGETPIAAVGFAGQWSFLLYIFLFGTSSGASVFISQYWGAKDMKGIRRAYGLLLVSAMAVGVVFALPALLIPHRIIALFTADQEVIAQGAQYLSISALFIPAYCLNQVASTVLRSTENVKLPMFASAASVLINVALNYVFIFGKFGFPMLGLRGAAIATVIATWCYTILLYAVSLIKRNILRAPIRELLTFKASFVKQFYKISLPVIANESLWGLGTVVFQMVLGRMGTGNYSALAIERTIESIAYVFFNGFCHACMVLVGKSVGIHDTEKAKLDAKRFIVVMMCISVMMGIVMILIRGPVIGLFNVSDAVRTTAMTLVLIYAIEMNLRFVPFVTIVGIFRAGGDTKTGFKYDTLCVWLIALPMTAISGLVLKLPFPAVFLIMLLSEDIVKTVLCLRHFFSYKWIQPVTEKPVESPGTAV